MSTISLLQKILRRIKNTLKYLHARVIHTFHKRSIRTFSRQQTFQFQRPLEQNVWIDIPTPSLEEITEIVAGKITIFGHTTHTSQEQPHWHHDLRLPPQQNPNIATTFSFDIKIQEIASENLHEMGFDIKYPWERSRLQYLLPLGKAFHRNIRAQESFDFFKQELESWIAHNPYLHGPNWMNAMEVSIRSTTMLWLLSFFYTEQTAKAHEPFWNSFLTSLHEHAQFIATYWEDYDAPNNHYLFNLTGSWYLARFFSLHGLFPFGNITKLWKSICDGFNHQLSADGTLYESSTAYHGLALQCLQHISQLNILSQHTLSSELREKLVRGTQFLSDSFYNNTNQVVIGDSDSGYLVWPLTASLITDLYKAKKQELSPIVHHYQNFGIVFITNKNWHISLRTKSFQQKNPTGHAHADLLGITVSYQGNLLIVDPGTGCYTANTSIRNTLRSWDTHSTLWQPSVNLFDFSKLFSIGGSPIPKIPVIFSGSPHAPAITAQYNNGQILFTRSLKLDAQSDSLFITDSANSAVSQKNFSFKTALTMNPSVNVTSIAPTFHDLTQETNTLALRCKKTAFTAQTQIFSQNYGVVTPTKQLVAECVTPYHDCLEIRLKTQTPEI